MFDTIVILKNGSRTAVQQLQNCCTNKRQTKLKHLRLCILNLSATYEQPANPVLIPKISFTDVCTSGFAIRNFSSPLLISFRSQVSERTQVWIVYRFHVGQIVCILNIEKLPHAPNALLIIALLFQFIRWR